MQLRSANRFRNGIVLYSEYGTARKYFVQIILFCVSIHKNKPSWMKKINFSHGTFHQSLVWNRIGNMNIITKDHMKATLGVLLLAIPMRALIHHLGDSQAWDHIMVFFLWQILTQNISRIIATFQIMAWRLDLVIRFLSFFLSILFHARTLIKLVFWKETEEILFEKIIWGKNEFYHFLTILLLATLTIDPNFGASKDYSMGPVDFFFHKQGRIFNELKRINTFRAKNYIGRYLIKI